MKNEILDELTRDSFADFLEKGETILWRGNPRLNKSLFYIILSDLKNHFFGVVISLIILTLFFKIFFGLLVGIFVFSILLLFHHAWVFFKNRKKQQTLYAISQKRIFFSFNDPNETNIHIVDFTELENFIVTQDNFQLEVSTFFLGVKNPSSITFTTYNLKNSNRRHQPTLELIEDYKIVSKLLREGIKNANASI